jgi:hypothetical protein
MNGIASLKMRALPIVVAMRDFTGLGVECPVVTSAPR